jgi:hypothetical protein
MEKNQMSETNEVTGLRKISVKTVVGRVPSPPEKGTKALMIVYGQAQGSVTDQNDYGEYTALVGTFEAVNLSTGEVFAAPRCFLVGGFDKMIAQRLDKGAEAVDFAFEVGIKAPGDDSNQKYEYVIKAIRDPKSKDPLEDLRATVKGLPQLAAPSADAKAGKGK